MSDCIFPPLPKNSGLILSQPETNPNSLKDELDMVVVKKKSHQVTIFAFTSYKFVSYGT